MRFAVCQLVTPNIDSFAKYSAASILSYCEKHGYSYYLQRNVLLRDLHINWSKIQLANQILSMGYDYVILIDADILLMDLELSLQGFVKNDGIVITMVEDTHLLIKSRPNAGFIMIKNGSEGKKVVKKWIEAAYSDRKLADKHPRNQRIYWKYVQPDYENKQDLIPYKYISKYFFWLNRFLSGGLFAYHFDQTNDNLRSMYMRKEYRKLGYSEDILSQVGTLLSNKEGLLKVR
ncbi:MAG: hypothetical protein HRT61_02635 [Ekhidna sp.]|nr:hypothetical protein [Ekhidna sp.]